MPLDKNPINDNFSLAVQQGKYVQAPYVSKYDIGASYQTLVTDINNYRDQQQGFLDTMGNGAARFLLGTGQKVAQGGAFVGGALYGAFNSEVGVMDAAINNGYSKVLSEFTDIIDTEYPIYKGSDFENLSAFELLGDARWWASQGADMASFVASMALSAKGLDKLGLFRGIGAVTGQAGKVAGNLLGNAQKGLKIGQGLGYYGSATITNSAIEGFFEASEVYKNNFKNYQELVGLNEEQAKLKALEDATSSWKWNQAILLPSSLFEMKLLLGGASSLGKGALRYFNSATDEIIKPTIKQYAKNIGVSALEGIVAEGIWEENIQLAVQKHLEDVTAPTNSFIESAGRILGHYINNFTEKEGQESILGGAVLGALMGGGGSYLNTKKEFKDAVNRYTKLRESGTFLEATEDVKKIKNLDTNNFTVIESTPETTNELGQIIPSVSTPKINKNKLLQTLNNLSLNLQTDKIAQIVDTMPDSADIKEFLTDSLLSNVVASYSSQGLGSLLLNKFNNVQISEEDRAMFGLYDSQDLNAEQIIQNNKNKVKTLIKKFDKIADIYKAIPNLDINHIFRLSVAKDSLDTLVRNIETDLSRSALSFYSQALNENDPLASKITTNYTGTANDTFRKDILDLLKNKNNSPEKQDYFNKYNKLEFLKKLQNQYIQKLKIFTDPNLAPIAYAAQAASDQQNQNKNINTIINQSNIEVQGGNSNIILILNDASNDNPIQVTTKDGKSHTIIGAPQTNSNNQVTVETDTGETILVNNINEIIPKVQTPPVAPVSKKEPIQEEITSTDNTITTQDKEELDEINESSKKKTTIFTTSISDETGDKDILINLAELSKNYKKRLNDQITQLEIEGNSNLFVMLFPIWNQDGSELTEDARKYLDPFNKELAKEYKTKDAIYAVVMQKEGDTYKPVVTDADGNILKEETEDSYYIVTSVNKSTNVKNLAEIPLIIQNIAGYTREELLEMKSNDNNTYKSLLLKSQKKEEVKINNLRNSTISNYYKGKINYHKIDSFSEGHNNAERPIDLINSTEGVVKEKDDIKKLFIPTSKENKPKNTLVGKLYAIIKKDKRTVRVIQPKLGELEGKVDLIISLLDMYFSGTNTIKDDNSEDNLIYSDDFKKPGILNLLIYFKKADMYYLKTNQIYFENGNLYYGNDTNSNTPFVINKENYEQEKEDLRKFLESKFLQLSPNLLESGKEFYEPLSIKNNTLITKKHSNYKSYLLKLNLKAIEPPFNEIARVNKYFIYNNNSVPVAPSTSTVTPTTPVAPTTAPVVTPAPTTPVSDIKAKKADIERLSNKTLKSPQGTINTGKLEEAVLPNTIIEESIAQDKDGNWIEVYINNPKLQGTLLARNGNYLFRAMQGRFFVIAKVGNFYLPFYISSAGTSGKNEGEWYPFFGFNNWLVKGSVGKKGEMEYSEKISEVQKLLNDNFRIPAKYFTQFGQITNGKGTPANPDKVFYDINTHVKYESWFVDFDRQKDNKYTEEEFVADRTGLNPKNVVNDGKGSANSWIKDVVALIEDAEKASKGIISNAELAALEKPTDITDVDPRVADIEKSVRIANLEITQKVNSKGNIEREIKNVDNGKSLLNVITPEGKSMFFSLPNLNEAIDNQSQAVKDVIGNVDITKELAALEGAKPTVTPIETINMVDTISSNTGTIVEDEEINLDEFVEENSINFEKLEEKHPKLKDNNIYIKTKNKIKAKKPSLDIIKNMLNNSFC